MLEIGAQAEAHYFVTAADTAQALAQNTEDEFPPVFATAKMIALMEVAASRVMKPLLQPGQLSVGVGVYVKHLAATPINNEVRAIATFLAQEGKLYRFRVEAFDRGGKIGEGEHTRAIIDIERLISGATARISSTS